MAHNLGRELDTAKALGHSLLALVTAGLALAVLAVLLSPNSATASIIKTAFAFLAWLVSLILTPLQAGNFVDLKSTQDLPVGGYAQSPVQTTGTQIATTAGDTGAVTTGTGTGQATSGGGTGAVGGAVIDVPIGSTPSGQEPLYQNGIYVGHVMPGTALPQGQGFSVGPVQ
jgi:hypothetical protein